MSTTTDLTTLKINYLTQSQYEEALDSNTIGANEIYMTPAADFTRGKVGVITAYAGADEPTGWLQCDGRAISRTTYAELFNVIGITYGAGDGSTTFNLPDLRDSFPVGAGTSYDVGDTGGEAAVALTKNTLPNYTIGYMQVPVMSNHAQWSNGGVFAATPSSVLGLSGKGNYVTGTSNTVTSSTVAYGWGINTAGGGEAHENMPPYVAINFLICYENNHISGAGNVNAQLITWEEVVER